MEMERIAWQNNYHKELMEGKFYFQYKTRMKLSNNAFRVNGELNGVSIIAQDLHCYVVTEDGRTYTAISRISENLGWQMQGQSKDVMKREYFAKVYNSRCCTSWNCD